MSPGCCRTVQRRGCSKPDRDDDVLAAAAAVARSEAVSEVVPGARTVLVHLAPGGDRDEIGRQLLQLASVAEGTRRR